MENSKIIIITNKNRHTHTQKGRSKNDFSSHINRLIKKLEQINQKVNVTKAVFRHWAH